MIPNQRENLQVVNEFNRGDKKKLSINRKLRIILAYYLMLPYKQICSG